MKVKLWNDNVYDHAEKFKGNVVTIPAGSFIELDIEEAYELKGQFTPMPPDDYSGDVRKFYKMLRVDAPKHAHATGAIQYIDPVTGKRYETAAQLADALKAHAHLQIRDELAEEEAKFATEARALVEKDAEIAALRAELAALSERRGPGRPKKVVNE